MAAVVVPGAAAVKVAADAGPMLDILETAGYLAVVDIVPAVDISEVLVDMPAVEPQQVVGICRLIVPPIAKILATGTVGFVDDDTFIGQRLENVRRFRSGRD